MLRIRRHFQVRSEVQMVMLRHDTGSLQVVTRSLRRETCSRRFISAITLFA